MNSDFAERLKTALDQPLPGWAAHSEMINYTRPQVDDIEHLVPNARRGAVLALIYPKSGILHIVLTLRHSYQGHHSAQVSFPGGSQEAHDKSLWYTALREACEEVGLMSNEVQMLGSLSKVYIPPSNFLVSPFLALCRHTPQFIAEPREVARIIEAPLKLICDPAVLKQKPMFLKALGENVNVRYFDIDGETVWGATAMMLNELKHVFEKAGLSSYL